MACIRSANVRAQQHAERWQAQGGCLGAGCAAAIVLNSTANHAALRALDVCVDCFKHVCRVRGRHLESSQESKS